MNITLPKQLTMSKANLAIIGLSLALMGAIAIIIVDRTKGRSLSRAQPPAPVSDFQRVATMLFEALPNADQSTKKAHERMWEYLSSVPRDHLPSDVELRKVLASFPVPFDYEYFFKDCLPRYHARTLASGSPLRDANIILSIPHGASARGRIVVNENNATIAGIKKLINFDAHGSRAVFAGGYSSPFNLPAGLAIMAGVVVNPILQHFDGLLMTDSAGRILITNIAKVRDGLRQLDIRSSLDDYQAFVHKAIELKLSIIQGSLLGDEGQSVVDSNVSQKSNPRRVLFTTPDGGVQVYDSLKKGETLPDLGKLLIEKYHAVDAFNLETGPYNFCLVKNQDHTTDYSQVQPGAIVSNVIVIDF